MDMRHGWWMALFCLVISGCGSSPSKAPERTPDGVGEAMPRLDPGIVRIRVERKGGDAIIIPERPCPDGFCDGPSRVLGPATGYPKFTLVDLEGEPGPLPEPNDTMQLSKSAKFPAALVFLENAKEHRREEVIHLLDLRYRRPRHIWRYRATARDFRRKGEGVDLDAARLMRDEDGGPLIIEVSGVRRRFIQDGVRAKPKVPFTIRFRFTEGGEYRRM